MFGRKKKSTEETSFVCDSRFVNCKTIDCNDFDKKKNENENAC